MNKATCGRGYNMKLEKFLGGGRGYKATCSLRTNAQIGFNRGSIRRFSLEDGYVVLFYSKDDDVIGVKPGAAKDEEGAVRLLATNNNAFISGRSFLEYYNIPYSGATRQYNAVWSEEHEMILVDLKDPIKKTQARSKKTS